MATLQTEGNGSPERGSKLDKVPQRKAGMTVLQPDVCLLQRGLEDAVLFLYFLKNFLSIFIYS